MAYPEPIERLIREFEKLPGIGQRTAERLAFWIVGRPVEEALRLSTAIRAVKETVRLCSVCCNVCLSDPCEICAREDRERSIICVVEESRDVGRVEMSGAYRGVYHVLHGRLAPLDGVGPADLTTGRLLARVRAGGVAEVILATNPTVEGDATAHFLANRLAALGAQKGTPPFRVTRIACGVPTGSTLEYASRSTITEALRGRREMSLPRT